MLISLQKYENNYFITQAIFSLVNRTEQGYETHAFNVISRHYLCYFMVFSMSSNSPRCFAYRRWPELVPAIQREFVAFTLLNVINLTEGRFLVHVG